MTKETRIKYQYTSTLPQRMCMGSPSVIISNDNSNIIDFLNILCYNSSIKDENGKTVSTITNISYEIIE